MKLTVSTPQGGWKGVSSSDVGILVRLNKKKATVDFNGSRKNFLPSEIEPERAEYIVNSFARDF